MAGINPINQLYNTINHIEKLRTNNENERTKLQRKNDIKTALKVFPVAAAMPISSAAIVMSGIEPDNMQVT